MSPGEGEDDPVSQAQRADAWRRMWGFPSEAVDPAENGGVAKDDDQHGTEGGR